MSLSSLIGPSTLDELVLCAMGSPPGAIVEVGVYQGGSAQRLYEVARQQGRELWLFDTFAGHPYHDPNHDTVSEHYTGKYADAIDPEQLQRLLPEAHVVVGTFPDTLPAALRDIAFVHADGDLWQTTLDIATILPTRMVPGGRIWFDDYGVAGCEGCTRAVDAVFGPPTRPWGPKRWVTVP